MKRTAKKRPQPRRPTPEQMARIVEAAWNASNEWGLYVWLSAVTSARRGEVIAPVGRHRSDEWGFLRLDKNYVRTTDGMIIEDTKAHQIRRVSIDEPTVELLRRYKRIVRGDVLLRLPLRDAPIGVLDAHKVTGYLACTTTTTTTTDLLGR